MRGMKAAHARLDAYSHHPYPVTRGERPFAFARGVCRYCTGVLTLANLPKLVAEVRRGYTLEVRVSNAKAIDLYERLGFRSRGLRRGYYTDNREDALIMWKDPVA